MTWARCGYDVLIDNGAVFKRPSLIFLGDHVAIDHGFYCTTGLKLGNYVHIGPYATCIGGADTFLEACGFNNIMAGARLICGSDRFDDSGLFGALIPQGLKGKQIIAPIVMEEFSNVGTNSVVMPGAILRQGVLLSVGSVLFGDTEAWGIYKGNPAVLIKKINKNKIIANAAKLGYKGA
jgi:acetyltransferase-like isoleucine patch superfamily enzyme